ncbi:Aspartic proteinase-like protein 2 [Camellia lanceoleosa]|uniref:Aspartic proteinase-like protein 2 n=1 Tax=Camellia lanceoleosa TaxID=1840588 RepID=A0ACC0IQS2_9ERIC|nr:Aspartic proteinase-like protein 2 [Camellia lanceoleosa]
MNGSVAFGCGAKRSGQLGSSSQALDGILGFGQANSSMISQLASVGKVKKCLHIAWMVLMEVKSLLLDNWAHYNVILKAIEVGHDVLQLPTDVLDSQSGKAVVIDSGTTLAYLADDMFTPLMEKIMAAQPDFKLHTVEQQFTSVNFRFENSLSLTIVPSEYLFQIRDNVWCVGWQNGGMQWKDGKELTLLGGFIGIGPVL